MKRIIFAALIITSTTSSVGHADSDDFSSACATLEFMAKMVTLNKMIPAHGDSYAEAENMLSQLSELNSRTCQSAILTTNTRFGPRYDNGALIANDLYNDAWYFPNGQVFMAAPGHDVTIFYPNGRPMAYHWTHSGEPVFWPNGNLATPRFRYSDVTWYYPDGNIVTYEAGNAGGRWFYPFQRFDGRVGQQVISSEWGIEDENFYYLNFSSDGNSYLTRERIRRKLSLTDYDLLDVPGVLLLITRLYQLDDEARLFTPADTNITGAPY